MTQTYQLFPPRGDFDLTINQIPKILTTGLEPALFATMIKGRMDGHLSLYSGSRCTGSGVLYHETGKVKVGLSHDTQRAFWKLINPETELHCNGILLPEGFYEGAQAQLELSPKEAAKFNDRGQTDEATAHRNEVLVAEIPDHNLREAYVSHIFREVKNRFDQNKAMGVWFSPKFIRTSYPPNIILEYHDLGPLEHSVGLLWELGNFYGQEGDAYGSLRLDKESAHLVGVQVNQQVTRSSRPFVQSSEATCASCKSYLENQSAYRKDFKFWGYGNRW